MLLFLFLYSFVGWAPAGPSDSEVKAVVGRLEAAYRPAKTLQATFLERYIEDGHTVRAESGIAYFRRPGKMRFEYQAPEKNLFLVDGKYAWFYVPADHTVTKVPAKESADWRTPLALLAGEMKVSRVCGKVELASQEQPENPADVLLYCAVRGASRESARNTNRGFDPQISKRGEAVFFEVVRDSGQLTRIVVRESGGIEMEFRFTHWQFDPQVADSQFHFNPPLGVAIVNGELAAQNSAMK